MKLSRDQFGGLFMLLFSCTYGVLILEIPAITSTSGFDARSMPTFLAGLGILFSLGLLCRRGGTISLKHLNWRLGITFVVLLLAYSLTLRAVGFLLSTVAFLFSGFWLLGERNWVKSLVLAGSVSLGFWLIMSELLGLYLPAWPALLSD